MGRLHKILDAVLDGRSDGNLPFRDLCLLLIRLGFDERIRGSHHIFTRPDVEDILNLQPRRGCAKPYQVRQVRKTLLKYGLRLTHGD